MGKKAVTFVKTSLIVLGALTLVTTVGLFMVGLEEIHPEAWAYDD